MCELPPPPRRPEAYACCGRGCSPCIFDYYNSALDRWQARMRTLGHEPPPIPKAVPGLPR